MPSIVCTLSVVSLLTLLLAAPVAAQDEHTVKTTISAIDRGEADAVVYLEGAVLYREDDDDEYVFSDGTGTITIEVEQGAGEGELPLFELIGIEGTLETADRDEIDLSRWSPLRIMTPAVIVEEPQVIEAFRGWIVAYGSQAPAPLDRAEPKSIEESARTRGGVFRPPVYGGPGD